ncbi:MAG: four-helix bundle copper-binding protein [Hyphomicrobiaceae bacterium]|nr:four-helix bundle copper-binding protein [Hyphomicrobiaceae bacterium]
MHKSDKQMQKCIEDCMACAQACYTMAMHHCLEKGGQHTEPQHFRLMMACADVCKTAASVMIAGITQHQLVCAACAEICKACAESCERIGDMAECVAACQRCEASCRKMSGKVELAALGTVAH